MLDRDRACGRLSGPDRRCVYSQQDSTEPEVDPSLRRNRSGSLMLRAPPIPFPIDMTFAERLVQLRKQHGLTQQALVDRAEIHVTLLRRYEAGKTQPNIDTLRRIALALPVSADQLLFDENERGPADELRSQFEATQQLNDDEKQTVKRVLEGLLLAHEAKRWAA